MRRERRQALLDALLVANIGEDLTEHWHARRLSGRDMQAGLSHQRQQAGGLQRNCLAAGVWAGDQQDAKIAAQI